MNAADRSLCVVIHDVAPATWEPCRWLLDGLAQHGVSRVTLLAVPRYHRQPRDQGFERWLRARAAAGDEVALHGFDHLDGGTPSGPVDRLVRRVYTRGEGEFSALDFEAATQRLQAGRRWLDELGIAATGFVAPAWLLGPGAWRALRLQPFRYTCTLRRIHLLGAGDRDGDGDGDCEGDSERSFVCQSQVYSSQTPLRQHLSVAWNETLALFQRHQPVVRLELHPGDDAKVVRDCWERLVRTQTATRRVRTLSEVAHRFRTSLAPAAP